MVVDNTPVFEFNVKIVKSNTTTKEVCTQDPPRYISSR
jgi:hypothetical protein